MWENYNGLDLHVVCPSGGRIMVGTASSAEVSSMDANIKPDPRSPSRTSYGPRTPLRLVSRLRLYYQFHKKRRTKDPTKFEVVVH